MKRPLQFILSSGRKKQLYQENNLFERFNRSRSLRGGFFLFYPIRAQALIKKRPSLNSRFTK